MAPDKPWLVLCDVTFGRKDEALADPYGNTPFHGCAYQGNLRSLHVLLEHVQKHRNANLLRAVRDPSAPPEAKVGPYCCVLPLGNKRILRGLSQLIIWSYLVHRGIYLYIKCILILYYT